MNKPAEGNMQYRFRGYLPVVIDVETGGFDEKTDALLELAAVMIEADLDEEGRHGLRCGPMLSYNIEPFTNARLDKKVLKLIGIDPFDPAREAMPEKEALLQLFSEVRRALQKHQCTRAILVGHNAAFDLKFLNAAVTRNQLEKENPFHGFSSIDTVSLGVLQYGQTVLSKIAKAAALDWDSESAHSAAYDAMICAKIFCKVFNLWPRPFR